MPIISHNFTLPDQSDVLVSVDFTKNDEIFSYDFQFKDKTKFEKTFKDFKVGVENNNLKNLINENWAKEFNLPMIGLFVLFDIYRANRLKVTEISEQLVCRCFNVSQKEINKIIDASQTVGLREILNQTSATGGCGSCVSDIKELLAIAGKEKVRFGGMTASEVLLFIEQKRLDFKDASKVEILGIEGYSLRISNKEHIEAFRDYLKNNGIDINLTA